MAVGTLVFDRSSYETVLCLGLLLDKDGRKMSKHLGNGLDPFALMEEHAPTGCAGCCSPAARRGRTGASARTRSARRSARSC